MNNLHVRRLTRYQIRREMQRRRLTQEDVALRAQVSQPLVSRALARHPRIAPQKAVRVFEALEQLFAEYQPIDTRAKVGAA